MTADVEISAFFSYSRGDNDDYGIVTAFYDQFKEVLKSKGLDKVPFLDIADLEQYGPLEEALKESGIIRLTNHGSEPTYRTGRNGAAGQCPPSLN